MEKNVIFLSEFREKQNPPAHRIHIDNDIDFVKVERLNKIKEERQRAERLKANEQVLKSYRIKSSK